MSFFQIAIGVLLITVGASWIIIFKINEKKMIERYAKSNLTEYWASDVVPENAAQEFVTIGAKKDIKE